MSISLIITHPASASISSLPKPISPSPLPTQTPLPIPSRFPPSSRPHLTPSPSGRLFLHSQESHFIWEYDHKGRRVGEMVFGKQDRVNQVVCGDAFVGVLLDGREGVEVMEKESERLGKWKKMKSVEGPGGVVTALASDGKHLLAIGTDEGGLVVCNVQDGTRTDVSLEGHSGASHTVCSRVKLTSGKSISPLLSFAPSLPNTLILPSQTSPTLLRIALTPQTITSLSPFPSPAYEPISSISFSPVTESPDGTRKGGLCALAAGGQVVLVGLDRAVEGSLGKRVGFGQEVGDVVFLDGATLGGKVKGGKGLLVKDLRALDKSPLEFAFGEEVVKAQAKSSQSSKPTTRRVSNTSTTSALGEINTNLPPTSRPATHAPGNKTKAPAPSRPSSSSLASTKPRASSTIVPSQTDRVGREKEERRSTSGPVVRDRARKPLGMSTRTIEVIEEEEAEQESPGPSRITCLVDGALTRQVPEPVEEEEDEEEEEEWQEPGVDLTWALHPPRPSSRTQSQTGATHTRAVVEEGGMSEKEQIAHLRREMAFMHMDMLRMGRDLRNEMKAAVDPLKEEIQTSRVVIEKQRREIERLRRGY
ncbi:hypothetical protein L198_02403 [Cryptococcus wingfieldii CBS 7118]|uniref:Uncharacterized protein n=1 Tax=Cryptococcus wingfieldii CBS 7118 TaxID=1295528 RepID=A0A1E3JRT3_9TREE|nr:hypothetical protein L198_02403 [Cryptococcus wingfieldii CBS 7118]ODO03555.1 hypothetical protein L198_02403 [Cryptococcus wingfieldii CBS 7118]